MAKRNGSQATLTHTVPTGFDQVLHLRYRLFLPALLGHQVLTVYDALRSCIWRQDTYGPENLMERAQRGYLAAQVPQKHLGMMTGVARQRVNMHLKRLERMGWVSSSGGQRSGGPKTYELGIRKPQHSHWAEALYADGVMIGWYEQAEGVSQARFGRPYRKLDPDDQFPIAAEIVRQGGVTAHNSRGVTAPALAPPVLASSALVPPDMGGVTPGDLLQGVSPLAVPSAAFLPVAPEWRPDAAAFAFAPAADGGVTPVVGGVTGGVTQGVTTQAVSYAEVEFSPPETASEPDGIQMVFHLGNTPGLEGGGVTGGDTGCHGSGQVTASESAEKSCDFGSLSLGCETDIHSMHRMLSPTGKESSISYLFLSPFGERSSVQAVASESEADSGACSLRSLASEPILGSSRSLPEAHAGVHLEPSLQTSQTPKPPVAPAPLSPGAGFGLENLDRSPGVTSPERISEVSPVPVRVPRPSLPPDPDPASAPDRASAPLTGSEAPNPSRLADLASVVEEAKARSRAAVEAKLAKQRAKDQKRANLSSDASYRAQKTAAMRIEEVWREEMKRFFPDVPQIAWFKREGRKLVARKEGKLVADLIDGYGGDEAAVTGLVRVFVQRWGVFGPMLTKSSDGVPTLGLLYACHATVMAESRKYAQQPAPAGPVVSPITAYEDWIRDHSGDSFSRPPPELEAAYVAAKAAKKGKP